MRVTSNTYSTQVISSSQNSQQQLATLQEQISTGDSISFASDNPTGYVQAEQTQSNISQLNAYNTAASQATSLTSANNSAMSSIHQIVAQASELATSVTSAMPVAQMQGVAAQMDSLISQLTSVVNQTSGNNYLFGGTANQPPIDSSGTYNSATNGATSTIDVQPGTPVTTGIVAGRPGNPPVDGFLYNATTGVDVLAAMQQTSADLKAGNGNAVQTTDLTALNAGLDNISMYVGSTAASMAAVSTSTSALAQQTTSMTNQLNGLTQTNLPVATLQLQQIQMQYQASLEAGSRILDLSMLNYMSSIPTG